MPAAAMAPLTILVSLLAAGVFAKRVATKHGILPGSVQPALPPRLMMPRASVPVGMSMPEGGNPSRYAADPRAPWKAGLHTSRANTFRMRISAEDMRTAVNPFTPGIDVELTPELTPEEVAVVEKEHAEGAVTAMDHATPKVEVMPEAVAVADNEVAEEKVIVVDPATPAVELAPEAVAVAEKEDAEEKVEPEVESTPEEVAAAEAAEKENNRKLNVRQAYDSLRHDIPQILRFESKIGGTPQWRKIPMNWDIYTEDLQTDFANVVNDVAPRLFAVAAPTWATSLKGLDIHKKALQELRFFIDSKVERAVVTGQDYCNDDLMDWCVVIEEGGSGLGPEPSTNEVDQIITYSWKTDLTMKPYGLIGGGVTPSAMVTIKALSKFHLNDEGKIYRHSIDQIDILSNQESMKPEDAEFFLTRLVDAPTQVGAGSLNDLPGTTPQGDNWPSGGPPAAD